MLAYILAVLVGTSSVGLYLWAFFFPEIHRKQDFIWSGVGLFYALFLWLYAHQVTGGILVGQTTSVALLGWFGWETFKLRRQLVPVDRSSNLSPSPTKRQNQRELDRAVPNPAKPTAKASTASLTASTATHPLTPATPPTTSAPSSIPLAQLKVPPATPGSAPVGSRTTSPQPTSPATNSSSAQIAPPEPIAPVNPSPVIASPQQISQSIESIPVTGSTSQPIPLLAANSSAIEEEEAWIKLEIKPAPTPVKPLGSPAQPPTILTTAPAPSPAAGSKSITTDIPVDPSPVTTELESENWA